MGIGGDTWHVHVASRTLSRPSRFSGQLRVIHRVFKLHRRSTSPCDEAPCNRTRMHSAELGLTHNLATLLSSAVGTFTWRTL